MHTRSRTVRSFARYVLAATGVVSLLVGSMNTSAPASISFDSDESCTAEGGAEIQDAALAQYRVDLLELAFRAASKLPLDPHIKNRSREQEAVAVACLELDQPLRALRYFDGIQNWRRGSGLADFALYCAEAGAHERARDYLEIAVSIADESARGEDAQEWRSDRIRQKVGYVYGILGQHEQATTTLASVSFPDDLGGTGKPQSAHSVESFDVDMTRIDAALSAPNFEAARSALETCAHLYGMHYAQATRRAQLEERVKTSWPKFPPTLRIELIVKIANTALEAGDADTALDLAREAEVILHSAQWTPDFETVARARLALLRGRAGDEATALRDVKSALAQFDDAGERIVNIDRGGILRAVAEALSAIGGQSLATSDQSLATSDQSLATSDLSLATSDQGAALDVYRRAVEAGIENPNSRPRVSDLAATCVSLARFDVEPDAALWSRLREIHAQLNAPW